MEVLVDRGAGIDVHKRTVTVCVMTTKGRNVVKTLMKFNTFHRDLVMMRAWLQEQRVTDVAMEGTGEYWKPVYEVLEGSFRIVVANAQHVKNVPGRKTDPQDAEWLARLLRHGLLTPSFVPREQIRQIRNHTRTRRKVVQTVSRIENRAQKILEASGVKLGSVVSDVFGVTGTAILTTLAKEGSKANPQELSKLAKGKLKNKQTLLAVALESTFSDHDAELLRHQLELHRALTGECVKIESELTRMVASFEPLLTKLEAVPGIARTAAVEILGEIGDDMSSWKSSRHFAAWAGLCPGNHESAGKRKKISVRKGNPFLKSILVQCATAAVRKNGTYYQAKFHRIANRRGYKRAIVAIAHSMLVAIYHMIRDDRAYHELGESYFEKRSIQSRTTGLVKQLQRLGYTVELRRPA